MSETMNAQDQSFRRNLLANVSAIVLLGYLGVSADALAATDDTDRPTVWIELGGQFERTDSGQTIFSPPFFDLASGPVKDALTGAQRSPPFSIGAESKITFAPEDTNWVFSASIRYGRSNSTRHLHHETALPSVTTSMGGITKHTALALVLFGDGQADSRESHTVLDFQAGKDVGLGMFGKGGSSVFSAGVRFAQFTASSNVTLHARPFLNLQLVSNPGKYRLFLPSEGIYTAFSHARRDTHAVGPSLSWDASLPVIGNGEGVTLAFDWGVNAAILFGRQRAQVHHQTTGLHYAATKYNAISVHKTPYAHGPYDRTRSRTVTIPNVGGFAGVTFQKSITKISFGYRADLFFGAIDSGFDTVKRSNVGFYGPFASISVGLGG